MLVTILPFGTSIALSYYQTTKSLNDRFVSTNHDLIQKGEAELSVYLEDVAQMSTVLYRYTPFMNVMRDGISQDISTNQEEVRRALAYLFNSRPEIEQMHLYIDKGKDSYTNYHSRISGRGKYENIYSHPYYDQLRQSDKFSIIEPPHIIYSYNQMSVIPESQKKFVLSFHTILRDVPANNLLGFLSIDINLSKIRAITERLYTKNVEDLYVIDQKGVVIYASDEKEIGKTNKEKWFQKVKAAAKDGKSLSWNDPQFSGVIVYENFSDPYKGWYIVKRIPYDVLYQSARETALMNIFIGIITMVIVLVATMIVSFKLTAPIKILIANMKKVEKGKFEADFDSLGNDEIGMLGSHFKLMIAKINELILREYKLDIENKASQLRVLRSQINPHFLYNAFQSIGTLALKSNAVQVYSLLTKLSTMMRYSMNMKEDVVPFSAELQHVKSYLLLQKQRFDEQFEFDVNVQKEVEEIFVPKMILQPIVENGFKHGFDQQVEPALIQIKAFLKGENVVITVADNGKGLSEEQLGNVREHLLHGTPEAEGNREAIGLKNIYDRLQIYYSNQAELVVDSREEVGFMVTIEIPKEMPKEVEPE
ncbi:sensor histidine kinase [Bacillota bacterium Lsc_1132]